MVLEFFRISDAESLRVRLRQICLFVSLTATALLTAVFGVISKEKSGLAILWIALFPAFWLALRFACHMAWDTSFKKSWLAIPATPQQVLIACTMFFAPAIAFHSYMTAMALVGSSWPAGGAMIFVAIPVYFLACLLGLYVIYLPLLVAVLAFAGKAPNSTPQADAHETSRNDP